MSRATPLHPLAAVPASVHLAVSLLLGDVVGALVGVTTGGVGALRARTVSSAVLTV